MDLKEEEILGDAITDHWYYIAKGRALVKFLGERIVPEVLDVGAGSGVFSKLLIRCGHTDKAVCVDPGYQEEKEEGPVRFVQSLEKTDQKLILMMDVLEHVDDDVALLKQYTDSMPEDGQVLITVPAFQFLWSGHDVFLEHRRRYTSKTLHDTLRKAGLAPIKTRYFFVSLFPLIALIRMFKRLLLERGQLEAKSELKTYPGWFNDILIAIHDLERYILFPVNKVAGLSIFCICRKSG